MQGDIDWVGGRNLYTDISREWQFCSVCLEAMKEGCLYAMVSVIFFSSTRFELLELWMMQGEIDWDGGIMLSTSSANGTCRNKLI